MHSDIFNYIGIGNLDIAYFFIALIVLIIVLAVIDVIQSRKIKKMGEDFKKFMMGKNAESLENEISEIINDIKYLKENAEKNSEDIKEIFKTLKVCYRKMGLIKYDAFHEMGGKLSFSLCMLDEENNGFIMNSVHSNTGCYVYTKEIIDGHSSIELGEEEEIALKKALSDPVTIMDKINEEKINKIKQTVESTKNKENA